MSNNREEEILEILFDDLDDENKAKIKERLKGKNKANKKNNDNISDEEEKKKEEEKRKLQEGLEKAHIILAEEKKKLEIEENKRKVEEEKRLEEEKKKKELEEKHKLEEEKNKLEEERKKLAEERRKLQELLEKQELEEEKRKLEEEKKRLVLINPISTPKITNDIELKPFVIKEEKPKKLTFLEKAKAVIKKYHIYYEEKRLNALEENAKKMNITDRLNTYFDHVLSDCKVYMSFADSYSTGIDFKCLLS